VASRRSTSEARPRVDDSEAPKRPRHDAIRELVERNPGQATFEEYRLVYDVLVDRAPCRMLVFGAGRDSELWLDANEGGTTVFLENARKWADFARQAIPGIVVHTVRYPTLRVLWPLLRRVESLLLMRDLPESVSSEQWDVILVDAPRGTRWYRPGRMMSVYTASVLARQPGSTDVFVHDCHRKVEGESSDQFLGQERLVGQAGSMRHYRLG
jgi:hypothetical protein